MVENVEQKITKIEVKSKEQLDELYNCSALTFEGLSTDEESIKGLVNWLKKYSEISNPLPMYIISGKTMNIKYTESGAQQSAQVQEQQVKPDIQKLAEGNDIPFNIID